MKSTSSSLYSHRRQRGFALLVVMFLTTLVLLGAIAAAPYLRTERQREKEQEMIWRGKQYVRGIKLYYRKNGRFPTSVDDLIKPKVGSVRFMRQAYKDPMNKDDGAWRMIYVGPAGQLIGSMKPPQTFQIPGIAAAQPGTPAAGTPQGSSGFGSSGFGQASATPQSAAPGATNAAAQPGSGANGQGGNAASDDAANAAPSGLLNADSPLIGGNIIGVGSKVNKRSVIVYDKAKNYRLFEFVWNPSKDLANALNQAGAQVGGPNPNRQGAGQPGSGQSGFGQSGFGQSGFGQSAPAPTPAPNPPNDPNEMPMPTPPPQR
jgi:hypothetical protein